MATTELNSENSERTITETTSFSSTSGRPGAVPAVPAASSPPSTKQASLRHVNVVFGKVDTETKQSLAAAAQTTSIPTLTAFKDGSLVFSRPGAPPATALEQVITAAVLELDIEQIRTDNHHPRSA